MPRRVGLPGASELFRSTAEALAENAAVARPLPDAAADAKPPRRRKPAAPVDGTVEHTGRVRHDEKITIYVSSEELLALERLRLDLRAEHGLAVDRGRIVRAAIASALAAIAEQGADADVLKRLAQ